MNSIDLGLVNSLSVPLQGPFTAHVTDIKEGVKEGVKPCTAKISCDSYKL